METHGIKSITLNQLSNELQIELDQLKQELAEQQNKKDEYERMKVIIDSIDDDVWNSHCNGIFWMNPIFVDDYDDDENPLDDDFYFSQFTRKRCCKVVPKKEAYYSLNMDIDICDNDINIIIKQMKNEKFINLKTYTF